MENNKLTEAQIEHQTEMDEDEDCQWMMFDDDDDDDDCEQEVMGYECLNCGHFHTHRAFSCDKCLSYSLDPVYL